MRSFIAVLFGISLAATQAEAAGFLLNDHGARATGRADAVTATVSDGSAIFYNPAGIAQIPGWSVYAGANLILPSGKFDQTGGGTTETDTGAAGTPHAYVTAAITKELHAGLGFNTPFGLRLSWPASSPGRAVIRDQALRTFFISPVVGVDLGQWVPGLSLGGGPDLVPASVELNRDLVFGEDLGTAQLGGTAFGVGGRVGAMYKAPFLKGLSVGVTWRSRVKLDFEGDADIDIDPPYRASLPPDGAITASVTLPQSVLAGVAYRILPDLELELDVNWIGWSSYDRLVVGFADGSESVANKAWDDTIVIRAGVEYALADLGLDLRLGYAYDPTPIPATTLDVTLPDYNRQVITAGVSYNKLPANMFVDLAALWLLPGSNKTSNEPNTPPLKGTYHVSAWVLGLSLGAHFGGGDAG